MQPVIVVQLRKIVNLPAEICRVVEVEGVARYTLFIETHDRDRGGLGSLGGKIKVDVCFEGVLAQLTTEGISGDPTQEMGIASELAWGDRGVHRSAGRQCQPSRAERVAAGSIGLD